MTCAVVDEQLALTGHAPSACSRTSVYSCILRRLSVARLNRPATENGGNGMAKGDAKKEKTNKPKLSPKEKKAAKAKKQAAKASNL